MSTASGVLADIPYSFSARFEDGKGTNPEELIAAAHAGCFSKIPGATPEAFGRAADAAKAGCPVSKLLKAEITLDKKLEA